jgi:hypothetical protein
VDVCANIRGFGSRKILIEVNFRRIWIRRSSGRFVRLDISVMDTPGEEIGMSDGMLLSIIVRRIITSQNLLEVYWGGYLS